MRKATILSMVLLIVMVLIVSASLIFKSGTSVAADSPTLTPTLMVNPYAVAE